MYLKLKDWKLSDYEIDVDEALLKWFKQQRSENIAISGPLMVKARNLQEN